MRVAQARQLDALTSGFYETLGASFSATRNAPWAGWERVACAVEARLTAENGAGGGASALRLLDLGCGNCRFQRFMVQRFPRVRWTMELLDNCDSLSELEGLEDAIFTRMDLVEALLAGLPPEAHVPQHLAPPALTQRPVDLSVCFGVMHHLPTRALRQAALEALVDATAPGGLVAVSFWEFLEDGRLAAKAREAHGANLVFLARAGVELDLEEGDRLLGWQDAGPEAGAIRYCHSFTFAEVEELLAALGSRVEVADRFRADGRSGTLNEYLILQRKED